MPCQIISPMACKSPATLRPQGAAQQCDAHLAAFNGRVCTLVGPEWQQLAKIVKSLISNAAGH